MTYERYSAEWLVANCDNEVAFERAVKKQLSRLLEENADFRAACEHLLRRNCDQVREIVELKDRLSQARAQADAESRAYKKAYFQLVEQVAAAKAVTMPPVQVEMPPEFFEWRATRPSLTNLQAFLVWKEQKEGKAT